MSTSIFNNRKPDSAKLLQFGFWEEEDGYAYETSIAAGLFRMAVAVAKGGEVDARVMDAKTGEEYVLHRTSSRFPWRLRRRSDGEEYIPLHGTAETMESFGKMVKMDYEEILLEIAEKCFVPDVFNNEDTKKVISYVSDAYGEELEFLWKRFSDNAIWRRQDTGKWYGALLVLSKRKLGLDSDEKVDVIDLRIKPEEVEAVVDHEKYFPGYHMNKRHWYTICLDGSVPVEEICRRIDESRALATK